MHNPNGQWRKKTNNSNSLLLLLSNFETFKVVAACLCFLVVPIFILKDNWNIIGSSSLLCNPNSSDCDPDAPVSQSPISLFILRQEEERKRQEENWLSNGVVDGDGGSGNVNLLPGDLPGYTGWARPAFTLASFFTIKKIASSSSSFSMPSSSSQQETMMMAEVGKLWSITVQCEHPDFCNTCNNSNNSRNNSNNSKNNSKNNSNNSTPPSSSSSLFYIRAYGPAVVPGFVKEVYVDRCHPTYDIAFTFLDEGMYTVEVVLAFSNPPPLLQLPLPLDEISPSYEGYLLPNFPITLRVVADGKQPHQSSSLPMCTFDQLVETSSTSAIQKSRWVVIDKPNHYNTNSPYHHQNEQSLADGASLWEGYQWSYNSLGIIMSYQYHNCFVPMDRNGFDLCYNDPSSQDQTNLRTRTIPTTETTTKNSTTPNNNTNQTKQKIHIIYIGDSVFREQRNMMKDIYMKHFLSSSSSSFSKKYSIDTSVIELYGGMLRCNAYNSPNVTRRLQEIFFDVRHGDFTTLKKRNLKTKFILIFNTGLHDIHRLCGQEWTQDRIEYLGNFSTDSSTTNPINASSFRCLHQYRNALGLLINHIMKFKQYIPLILFQSTTAGWPKYGNYGIVWPTSSYQPLPLATEIIHPFNEIAYELIRKQNKNTNNYDDNGYIHIMDGYWITYTRPDNREVTNTYTGDDEEKKALMDKVIGKKLSHPGYEVLFTMTNLLANMISLKLCA